MNMESKGRKMFEEGRSKKVMDTDRRTHYRVQGDTEEHSVIFDKRKNDWGCDCQFFALRSKECSHIIACKMIDEKKD